MLRDLFSLFPAYAGVIPGFPQNVAQRISFPRICGGDPIFVLLPVLPRVLFPAYAGVILIVPTSLANCWTFPRICGGDPVDNPAINSSTDFSPHMRG